MTLIVDALRIVMLFFRQCCLMQVDATMNGLEPIRGCLARIGWRAGMPTTVLANAISDGKPGCNWGLHFLASSYWPSPSSRMAGLEAVSRFGMLLHDDEARPSPARPLPEAGP